MSTDLDRRSFFAASSLAAALATVPLEQAEAQTRPSPPPPRFPEMDTWRGAKAMLVQSREFDWLAGFEEKELSDAVVYSALSGLVSQEPPFDIYQLEHNIQTASATLDRCLTYRRELQELEAQAVQTALEYKLIEDQFASQLQLELAETVERQQAIQQEGQARASTRFKANDGLAAGFKVLAEAGARGATEAVEGERQRKNAVRSKWDAFQGYRDALIDRHRTPGHALNYQERAQRVRQYLIQDIVVAYGKCKAAGVGAKQILGIESAFPEVGPLGTLDRLVLYLRDLISSYELATQDEVEFEHVISLTNPSDPSMYGSPRPVPFDVWSQKFSFVGDRTLTLSLQNLFPAGMTKLRIKAVGITYVLTSPSINDAVSRTSGMSALLTPPQVQNPFSKGSFKSRPSVPFGRIASFDAGSVRFSEDPAFRNLDPRGTWTLQAGKNMLWSSITPFGQQMNSSLVQDIRLHFFLAGHLDEARSSWSQF